MTADGLPDAPRPRLKLGVGAAAVLVIAVLVVTVLVSAFSPRGSTQQLSGASPAAPDAAGSSKAASDSADSGDGAHEGEGGGAAVILVHVLGAVARPGLYELHDGDRIVDVIAAAGGFTETADQAQQNLARVVSDGEQVYVPAIGELPPPLPAVGGGSGGAAGEGAGGGAAGAGGVVDLNSATLEDLETLPRIGPATAQKILDYREQNGPFGQVDDLMNVTGIGEKTFDGLRDRITV